MTRGKGRGKQVCSTMIGLAGLLMVLAPAMAYAQSAIVGSVKDTSGAVLPGVTVEAASDVLIEKVRSVVTDGAGRTASPTFGPAPTRSRSRWPGSRRSSVRCAICRRTLRPRSTPS